MFTRVDQSTFSALANLQQSCKANQSNIYLNYAYAHDDEQGDDMLHSAVSDVLVPLSRQSTSSTQSVTHAPQTAIEGAILAHGLQRQTIRDLRDALRHEKSEYDRLLRTVARLGAQGHELRGSQQSNPPPCPVDALRNGKVSVREFGRPEPIFIFIEGMRGIPNNVRIFSREEARRMSQVEMMREAAAYRAAHQGEH